MHYKPVVEMKKILLLVALPAELGREAADSLSRQCDIRYIGVGKINAFEATLSALVQEEYDAIINAGTAGSFRHPFGTILYPSQVAQGDAFIGTDFSSATESVGTGDAEAAILSGDNFIGEDTPDAYRRLIEGFDCMDMESYAVVRAIKFHSAGSQKPLPKIFLTKVVSDGADGSIGDWATRLRHLRPTLQKAIQQIIDRINEE